MDESCVGYIHNVPACVCACKFVYVHMRACICTINRWEHVSPWAAQRPELGVGAQRAGALKPVESCFFYLRGNNKD